jgi:DNA-binding CsgD family transcriptional regulator
MRFAIQTGPHVFALSPGIMRIGRAAECEIRLDDESVSRAHATIEIGEDRVVLHESGSRNGVRVNGVMRRGDVDLAPGDRLHIGTLELVLIDRDPFPDEGPKADTRPIPRPSAERPRLERLSGRERDVLERIARGQTQREIAAALGISVKTYETYRARLLEKLELSSRSELVAFAIQAGILRARSVPPARASVPPPRASRPPSRPPDV